MSVTHEPIVIERNIRVVAVTGNDQRCPACHRKVKATQLSVRVRGTSPEGVDHDDILHQRCFVNSLTEY